MPNALRQARLPPLPPEPIHMLHQEPIFSPAPAYPSCHAATLVELPEGGLLAAWFAGTHAGHPDVAIWLARYDGQRWTLPERVAAHPGVPCWNPVLFRNADDVLLFYKVGPSVPAWSGACLRSQDGGRPRSAPALLPAGLLGPAKNKPITLANGDILCPTSAETWQTWACWVEISADGGHTWSRHGPIAAPGHGAHPGAGPVSATWDPASAGLLLPQDFPGVIQPTVWEHAPGRLTMLMRATRRVGCVCASHSSDYGRTWSPARPTAIPNPNSGLDAVRLSDGRIVLACNPVSEGRTPLSLLISEDNGETWPARLDLETGDGEYSYPSIIQAADGRLHVVYTWRRTTIAHATIGLTDLARDVTHEL